MRKILTLIGLILLLILLQPVTRVYAFEEGVAGISKILNNNDIKLLDMWTTDIVNLREKPTTTSNIITTLDKQIKVQMISSSNGWSKVIYQDKVGYIYSKYLRDSELPSLEFTDEEIDLIAKIIWLESRGEDDIGEAAVFKVIINRLLSINFSDTIYEVLSDKNQFTTWKHINKAEPTEREYEIIEEVLNGEWDGLLSEEYVYFSRKPYNNKDVIKIGNHYFCKE